MKKLLIITLAILMILPLTACGSAFDSPEDYVTIPSLDTITVSEKTVDERLDSVIKDILENSEGEHFIPITDSDETAKRGDRVHVSFSPDHAELSEETIQLLTAKESDRIYIIPGSDTMPKALEDIVTGSKIGSTLSAKITYTEEDTDVEELIGKTVTLSVTVHGISRLTVTERHAVKLIFTAELANGETPTDLLLPLLQETVETVALNDAEDTFDDVFSSSELLPHLIGHSKLETVTFSLTLPKDKAEAYGYDSDKTLDFTATIDSATDIPTELTDLLVDEMTYGSYTDADSYLVFCRNMVKEQLALEAIMAAAVFEEELPEKEYEEFYTENYNSALYSAVGSDVSSYTPEQLAAMLSADMLQKIEETAQQNTVSELKERLALEYLYDLFELKLSDDEYEEKLQELFDSYYANYYYMLYYYQITTPEALETYLGKDYIEVQFLYEKLLPLLKDEIRYTS